MTGSKNEEFIKFRNNVLVVFAVTSICIIFLIILFGKSMSVDSISKKMKKNTSFLIYITNNYCENCNKIGSFLDKNNVLYDKLNENSSQAKKIFKEYNVISDESISPAVIYVKDGEVYSYLVNLKDTEELSEFLNYYKLSE